LILPVFSSAIESKPRSPVGEKPISGFGERDMKILSRIRKDREKYGVHRE
jgi:hypothetical protein